MKTIMEAIYQEQVWLGTSSLMLENLSNLLPIGQYHFYQCLALFYNLFDFYTASYQTDSLAIKDKQFICNVRLNCDGHTEIRRHI